jgi:uncharacterized protein (UPF0548 family)
MKSTSKSRVFSFRKPSDDEIRATLDAQHEAPFTYAEVGAIEGEVPAGYLRNHVRVRLGAGERTYEAAVSALRQWRQFEVGWVELCWPTTTPAAGALVGVMAHVWGVWALSVSRIVTVINETGPQWRYAVIYGTLPQHAETGEERFQIEWDRSDDSVWYEVQAFYRPHHPLVRWTWPLVGHVPRKFVRESAAAIQRAICRDH